MHSCFQRLCTCQSNALIERAGSTHSMPVFLSNQESCSVHVSKQGRSVDVLGTRLHDVLCLFAHGNPLDAYTCNSAVFMSKGKTPAGQRDAVQTKQSQIKVYLENEAGVCGSLSKNLSVVQVISLHLHQCQHDTLNLPITSTRRHSALARKRSLTRSPFPSRLAKSWGSATCLCTRAPPKAYR